MTKFDSTLGTKTHYISALRQFVIYCESIRVYPFEMPIPTETVMYFIADRIDSMKSNSSIKNWTGMLGWLHKVYGAVPIYKNDNDCSAYIAALDKQYGSSPDTRLPFTLDHIYNYILSLGVSVQTRETCNLDNLLKAVVILVYFITMCRPCELVLSKWGNRHKGISFFDISKLTVNNKKVVDVTVKQHKSMRRKKDPKHTFITNTFCGSLTCKCNILNPYKLFSAYVIRRIKLQKLKNKKVMTAENIFVWTSGHRVNTTDITKLVKEIVNTNNIPLNERHRYTSYSLKIGGATQACAMGIDHIMLLKFVGWSDSFLKDSSMSYIRPKIELLVQVPFQMIHGTPNTNISKFEEFMNKGLVFDPWTRNSYRKR